MSRYNDAAFEAAITRHEHEFDKQMEEAEDGLSEPGEDVREALRDPLHPAEVRN